MRGWTKSVALEPYRCGCGFNRFRASVETEHDKCCQFDDADDARPAEVGCFHSVPFGGVNMPGRQNFQNASRSLPPRPNCPKGPETRGNSLKMRHFPLI